MATSLTINTLRASIGWSYSNTTNFGSDTSNQGTLSYSKTMTNGTGAGAAQKIYISSSTLAGGAALNLDLAADVTDVFGNTITFARVKVIYIEHTSDTTSTGISVGGHATAGLTGWIQSAGTFGTDQPAVVVRNGGLLMLACTDATAYPVTTTTGDILLITNEDGSNTATYKICIIGE